MLTSPCCKWWISLAVYRSNGVDMAIIETLRVGTALKNGIFWTLLSSYWVIAVHKVNQMRSQVKLTSPCYKWCIRTANYRSNGSFMIIIGTLHGRTALKNGSFWTLLSSYRLTDVQQWTKWGLIYADISLLQMMDKSRFLYVQRFGIGYDRNITC